MLWKSFVCWPENGPKHFDTEARPEKARLATLLRIWFYLIVYLANRLFILVQCKDTTQVYNTIFMNNFLPDYTKNAYNQRVSINVTHTTSTLPRQISTTKIPTMHSTMIGLDQGFSNYGSRPHLGSWNVILGPQKNWLTKSDYKFL